MDDKELNREIIMEALEHCLGMDCYDAEDSRCTGCPLYEDHYCVDTLYSVIGEKMARGDEGDEPHPSGCA